MLATLRALILAPALAASFAVAPVAQAASWSLTFNAAQPQIAVPERPWPGPRPQAGIAGCYQLQGRIYGPYRMSFCLDRRNSFYEVRGGGLTCEAGLNWWPSRNGATIQLQRARCGRGQAWTADTLECRIAGFPGYPGGPGNWGNGGYGQNQFSPQIAVPDHGGAQTLNCTYYPAVRGYPVRQFTARRV